MIELVDFHKTYGPVTAVRGLSLLIPEGEVFGLIGSNGAGKTTILRFLATLIEPTRGTAKVNGYSVTTQVAQVRRSVGYMPDAFGLYPRMLVWEFLDFFAAAYGIPQWRRENLISDLLTLMGLEEKRGEPVDGLSRGMKQRLGLARTLVHDPPALILDEPASGLDPRARLEVKEVLRELAAMGKTILISSHILSELADICTSVGIIEHGTLLAKGKLDDVLAQVRVHRVYDLKILTGADQAHEILKKNEKVFDLETGSNRFHFCFNGEDADVAELVKAFAAAEVPVIELREEPIDLEEAYFKLTKGKE